MQIVVKTWTDKALFGTAPSRQDADMREGLLTRLCSVLRLRGRMQIFVKDLTDKTWFGVAPSRRRQTFVKILTDQTVFGDAPSRQKAHIREEFCSVVCLRGKMQMVVKTRNDGLSSNCAVKAECRYS